jgi:hypothetical protein
MKNNKIRIAAMVGLMAVIGALLGGWAGPWVQAFEDWESKHHERGYERRIFSIPGYLQGKADAPCLRGCG